MCNFFFGELSGIRRALPFALATLVDPIMFGFAEWGSNPLFKYKKEEATLMCNFFFGELSGIRRALPFALATLVDPIMFGFAEWGSNPLFKYKKEEATLMCNFFLGELSGIRTPDTLLKRQVLCLLS